MKHKAKKQILSLLLAVVMLVGLLPTAAIPVFAVEESDIYAKDPNYEHGYFLGGRGYWEGGTWVREVYDWDDMDQVFKKLDSASMTNYGYVTVKLMENLELTSADSDLYDGYFKRYIIPAGLNNVIFDFNGHTLSGTNVRSNSKNFIKMEVREGNHVTFEKVIGKMKFLFYFHLKSSQLFIRGTNPDNHKELRKMKKKLMTRFNTLEWGSVDNDGIYVIFDMLGFKSVEDVVQLRVFELLNLNRINNNRAEEMLLCIYRLLYTNRKLDDGIPPTVSASATVLYLPIKRNCNPLSLKSL